MNFRIADIIAIVSEEMERSEAEIVGPSRCAPLPAIRAIVALEARKHKHSYPRIGIALGGRDHTSIINYVERAPQYAEKFDWFTATIKKVAERVENASPFIADKIRADAFEKFLARADQQRSRAEAADAYGAHLRREAEISKAQASMGIMIAKQRREKMDEAHFFEEGIANGSKNLAAALLAAMA